MLFQPTNITPDVINGIGNGTIDASTGLQVSWQVNGNTAMTAYEIFIYENDTASTQLYDTGVVDIEPFYGIDYQGNRKVFSAEYIDASVLGSAGITNGNQYKIMIRQYWSASDYIDQRSLSVFNTRSIPTLSLTAQDADGNTIANVCATRSVTIQGTYQQAENDAIESIRWTVSAQPTTDGQLTLLADSGMIYGTGEIEYTYDSMVNGINYIFEVSVQSAEGIVVTQKKVIAARWEAASISAETTVCKVNNQSTAMRVTWGGFTNITGVATGNYSIANGVLNLDEGASVSWSQKNGEDLSVAIPWAVVMRTTLQKKSVSVLKVDTADGYGVSVRYNMQYRGLDVSYNFRDTNYRDTVRTLSFFTDGAVPYDSTITLVVTPTQAVLRADSYTTGLAPSETLTPSATLAPYERAEHTYKSERLSFTNEQSPITRVVVSGNQAIDYIQVISSYASDDLTALINEVQNTEDGYNPEKKTIGATDFMTEFNVNTLDAGTLTVNGTSIEGWAVYRRKESEPLATHLVDVSLETTTFLDYGCASMEGMYHYEIYPIGNGRSLADAIITKSFNPCFENWSIIEAEYDSTTDVYTVVDEFIFGKNFSSGSISNNNEPTIYKNFTRYPTVLKSTPQYQSGTLQSLIGYIGYVSYIVQDGDTLASIASKYNTTSAQIIADNSLSLEQPLSVGTVLRITLTENPVSYYDSKELRDKIWNLSRTQNALFLKSRKGDLIEISTSQDLSMQLMDNTKSQAVTASVPWVQVGEAKDFSIVGAYNPYTPTAAVGESDATIE